MRPSLSEWIAGQTAGGRLLPLADVNAIRAVRKLPPIQRTDQPAGSQPSRGLGDTIHNIAHATGIDRVVKAVAGNGCGCEKRRQWLNDVFPYGESK